MSPPATLTPGLPPAGATGDFIGRDAHGNTFLLHWHSHTGWEAMGWEGAGDSAWPIKHNLAGQQQGLIVGHLEIAGAHATPRATPVQPTASVEAVRAALEPFAKIAGPLKGEIGRISYLEAIIGRHGTDELSLSCPVSESGHSYTLWADDFRRAAELFAFLTPAPTQGDETGGWLIRKGGYFYRPNRAGYTTRKSEAGRYTEADAKAEAQIEPGMKAIRAEDWPDEPTTPAASVSAPEPAAEMHGPFGHLVGAIGLDESHWRIEDNPCSEPGYFSTPMFTHVDPFTLMQEGDQ